MTPIHAAWPHWKFLGAEPFWPDFGAGIAVGPQGQIYVDTEQMPTPYLALLEILPSGRVTTLWVHHAF